MSLERCNSDARAGVPMSADNVRFYIGRLEAGNPNRNARKRMAELAINQAFVTDEGRQVWREYLETFKNA